jgi:serine/threonine protein kinase
MTALSVGHRLGSYEIIAMLGAGGMGEVYSARDTRLDRSVAIKVLPLFVSADHKLMAVPVGSDGATFVAGTPRALFDVEIPEVSAPYPTEYAVSEDGQRFLVNSVVEQATRPTLTVVLNWVAELGK